MIRETVIITAIEPDCLWVQAEPGTNCGSCAARQGCGQKLLARLMAKPGAIRVPLGRHSGERFAPGSQVEIGIPEDVVAGAALLVYLLPLAGLLVGCGVAQALSMGELGMMALGAGGLLTGALLVRIHAWRKRDSDRYNPVLLGLT